MRPPKLSLRSGFEPSRNGRFRFVGLFREVWKHFARAIENYIWTVGQVPWYWREESLCALLGAAAERAGHVFLVEWQCGKEGSKSGHRRKGYCDLYISGQHSGYSANKQGIVIEAKLTYAASGSVAARRARGRLRVCEDRLSEYELHAYDKVAICWAYARSKNLRKEVGDFRSEPLKQRACDYLGWVWLSGDEGTVRKVCRMSDDAYSPGVVASFRECR